MVGNRGEVGGEGVGGGGINHGTQQSNNTWERERDLGGGIKSAVEGGEGEGRVGVRGGRRRQRRKCQRMKRRRRRRRRKDGRKVMSAALMQPYRAT